MSEEDYSPLLPRVNVIYCGKCGMPPEYCEYGPDFETHCDPWLKKHHPELHASLASQRGVSSGGTAKSEKSEAKAPRPEQPWTTEERLRAFYEKYVPEKVDSIPGLLEKYAGKEDKLFVALTKKYGPEPKDPYFSDSDDDDDDDDDDENEENETEGAPKSKSKRRGVAAKKGSGGAETRVVVQKVSQKKRRHMTIIQGLDSAGSTIKLKDAAKAFSKRFAGSSSVKENAKKEKEIIIQGDHQLDVAEMIVDTFGIPEDCVFLDMEGDIVPLR